MDVLPNIYQEIRRPGVGRKKRSDFLERHSFQPVFQLLHSRLVEAEVVVVDVVEEVGKLSFFKCILHSR